MLNTSPAVVIAHLAIFERHDPRYGIMHRPSKQLATFEQQVGHEVSGKPSRIKKKRCMAAAMADG